MRSGRTLLQAAAALVLAGGAAPALAAELEVPDCAELCKKMIASGEARPDVSEGSCRVRVCQEKARRFYAQFEFDEALASLDQIHEKASFGVSYQLDRGLVNYALGHFDDALANFDTVLTARPRSMQAAAQRAHTLVRLGRVPEARAQFEAMLEFPAADREYKNLKAKSYIWGNLGVLRLIEQDLAGGVKNLRKALEIASHNPLPHTFLDQIVPALESGDLQYTMVIHLVAAFDELNLKRANAGLRELSTVINQSPSFRLSYLLAADTQRRYLDFQGCEMTLRVAELRFPDDTEVFANRIRCTMLRYGIDSPQGIESVDQLKELAARDPDDPLVQEILLLLGK